MTSGITNRQTFFLFLLMLFSTAIALLAPRLFGYITAVIGLLTTALVILNKNISLKEAWNNCDKTIWLYATTLLGLIWVSNLWSIFQDSSIDRSLTISLIFIFSALLIIQHNFLSEETLESYLKAIPMIVILCATLIIIEILFGYPIYKTIKNAPDEYIGNSLINKSVTAFCFMLIPAIAIIKNTYQNKKRAMLLTLLIASVGLAVFLSGSETAKLSLLLVAIAWILFPKNLKAVWYLGIIAVFAFTLAAPFGANYIYKHFSDDVYQNAIIGQGGGHGAQRLEIYNFVSNYAMQKPILGHGVDVTRRISDFSNDGKYQKSNRILHPHNYAIQIWLDFGAVGALLFAGFISLVLFKISRLRSNRQAFLSLFIVSMCSYCFSYSLWQSWLIGLNFMAIFIIILSDKIETLEA